MPYKSEKIKLPPNKDRRRKLTDDQKEQIKSIYTEGGVGTRPLAKQFGVSRKTIQLIVNPEIKRKNDERIKEHWRDYRPTKEEWAATMREHRKYKQQLYLNKEI